MVETRRGRFRAVLALGVGLWGACGGEAGPVDAVTDVAGPDDTVSPGPDGVADTRSAGDTADVDAVDADEAVSHPDPCPPDPCPSGPVCADGVVSVWPGGSAVDCPGFARVDCQPPHATHACAAGCGVPTRCWGVEVRWSQEDPYDVASYCAESQPAREGEACAQDADCAWPCAPLEGARFLRCDTGRAAPVCVVAPEPAAVADLGEPCGLNLASLEGAAAGCPREGPCALPDAAACTSGECVVAWEVPCHHQACTQPCLGDHACPTGWLCREVPVAGAQPTAWRRVCAPETLFETTEDLPCRAP